MTRIEGVSRLKVESSNQVTEIEGEKVLVAIGVQANTEDLGLNGLGVATERGFIRWTTTWVPTYPASTR